MFACHITEDLFLWYSVEVLFLISVLAGLFLPLAKLLVLPSTCPLLPLLDCAIFCCGYPWKPKLKGIEVALAWIFNKKEKKKKEQGRCTFRSCGRFELTCQRGWGCDPGEEGKTGKHAGFNGWEKLRQFGQNEEDLKRDTGKMKFNRDVWGWGGHRLETCGHWDWLG